MNRIARDGIAGDGCACSSHGRSARAQAKDDTAVRGDCQQRSPAATKSCLGQTCTNRTDVPCGVQAASRGKNAAILH